MSIPTRQPFDMTAYVERIQTGPCFICEMIAGRLAGNHIIAQDETAIVFLNKYPTLYGYVLVAPTAHREQVTGDFTPDEYLALQRVVYRVGEAVRRVVPTERLYILSLGSQQANRHVHWHVAPLPAGIPFAQQQLEALHIGQGVIPLTDDEMAELAGRIRQALAEGA
jgi:diadenosine tetraphosphate (Ap4A) HIT family hydrolase